MGMMTRGQERVVALIDMDCFYVQVEQKDNPELKGKPCAVVQYKTWQGGGIIAVSYEARAFGVTRGMRGQEAKKKCPQLQLARIPEAHGKADLSKYREASVQVLSVLSRFAVIERASIDEVFVDLTAAARERATKLEAQRIDHGLLPTTFVQGFPQHAQAEQCREPAVPREQARRMGLDAWLDSLPLSTRDGASPELQLTAGALIVEEMRAAVEQETGYRCSAGVSHNKVLAKLSCGLNKPNRQTVLPMCSVPRLFDSLPIGKIRYLGGKLGESVARLLNIEYMGQLRAFPEPQLQNTFGEKTGNWLFDLCRGVESEPVRPRHLPKSIGCSKNFLGTQALSSCEQVKHWLQQLATELEERLEKDKEQNQRVGKLLSVGVRLEGSDRGSSVSRCCALPLYQAARIAKDAFTLIQGLNSAARHQAAWFPAVTGLSLSISKFSELSVTKPIEQFLSSDRRLTETDRSLPSRHQPPNPRQDPRKHTTAPSGPTIRSIASYFQRVRNLPESSTNPDTGSVSVTPSVRTHGHQGMPQKSFPTKPSFFKSRAFRTHPDSPGKPLPVPGDPGSPVPHGDAPGSPLPLRDAPGSPLPIGDAPGSPLPLNEAPGSPFPLGDAPGSPLPLCDAPGSPLPLNDAPGSPFPIGDAPGSPFPIGDAPGSPFPLGDAPGSPLPLRDAPGSPLPLNDTPGSPFPIGDAPGSPLPVTDAPGSPLPVTDAPGSPLPVTDAPGSPLPLGDALESPFPVSGAPGSPLPLRDAPENTLPLGCLLQCLKCGEYKLSWEMPEHEDFHFALELQKSLSAAPAAQSPATTPKNKAARQLVSRAKKPRLSHSLLTYFQRPTQS
ncbi:DNA polymerase eta isoform X2 [Hemiscyllium ocellatum]|nr:DNA polymerase eta isoform X2 [Hemiscyllium ocellatum]XP_060703847.1 DNA polymerase eta isoform X2 [Hemiscyllium ocellatum]XP_060703856.1 DNA polymerase eta isoform X2 [Hemiscyllium ocellatum]